MELSYFNYEGHDISFDFGNGRRMINATEMAKPFKKYVADFLRLKNTKEYIEILEEERYGDSHIAQNEILVVIKGGDANEGQQGTWMSEKLALKFASWLAPRFEVWVYDRIHELLTTGKTEIQATPSQNIVRSIRLIADQLEAHDKDIQGLKEEVGHIKDFVSDLDARITSIDENYYTISGYCALRGIDCPLDKAQKWGYEATRMSHSKGRPIGKAYDAKYSSINTYHTDILKLVFGK